MKGKVLGRSMKAVIQDAFEEENFISGVAKRIVSECNIEYTYFRLKAMNILPCRGCNVCTYKTPGECVFKDDMPAISRAAASSSLTIKVTPIRFGGYPSLLKRVVDKGPLSAVPYLVVKNGRFFHPPRYGRKSLIVIGFSEKEDLQREENFKAIVAGNAYNMQAPYHKAIIIHSPEETKTLERELLGALQEVQR
ncbi:MAG: NAD(P)H-dependent oxidoreductase [Clostridia bacterium]|nr:NAD(P)H-dependent oxidoreductase [Clostridia bacterium]